MLVLHNFILFRKKPSLLFSKFVRKKVKMNHLKFSELTIGLTVQFHPNYQQEHWRDGQSPLTISDIYKIQRKEKKKNITEYAIQYFCSNPQCSKCKRMYAAGHILLLKKGGEHITPHVVWEEKKKRTITHYLPNPVFIPYPSTS